MAFKNDNQRKAVMAKLRGDLAEHKGIVKEQRVKFSQEEELRELKSQVKEAKREAISIRFKRIRESNVAKAFIKVGRGVRKSVVVTGRGIKKGAVVTGKGVVVAAKAEKEALPKQKRFAKQFRKFFR